MLLTPEEAHLFFKLYPTLLFFVDQRLHVLPDPLDSPEDSRILPLEARLALRDAFLDESDLIEAFVDENPFDFSDDELQIVQSWHDLVSGEFFIFRQLKKYMVFLSMDKRPFAYGALALAEPLEDLVGPYLPVVAETTLLPFNGKIVYDGLLRSYNVYFGGGIRRSLKESYNAAKKRQGIVTSLPILGVKSGSTIGG
jgi:hypothetical protein